MGRYRSKIQNRQEPAISPQFCLTCSGNCLNTCKGTYRGFTGVKETGKMLKIRCFQYVR